MKFKILFIIPLLIIGCKPSKKHSDNIPNDTILKIERSVVYQKYQIPLPVEIYRYIYSDTISNYLHLAEYSQDKINIAQNNALLLGLYSADLAFCSYCDDGQTILNYSDVCTMYAKKLNIDQAFNTSYLKRLKTNINKQDSLIIITNEVYNKTCKIMESNGMHNIMPFVVYAGWIESIYQALDYSGQNYTKIDTIIQLCKLENLTSYLYDVQVETNAYFYNNDIKSIVIDISEIQLAIKNYIDNYKTYPQLQQRIKKSRNKILNSTLL